MASVTYDHLTKKFGETTAINDLNIAVEDKEFLVLVGPSGCGKSTALRCLAGLEEISGGRILIGSRDVSNVAPKDRDIAMVFQSYALYPHMSVRDNLAFALKLRRWPVDKVTARVSELAELLKITALLNRFPRKLSGGEAQRVALGRALAVRPSVLCLDEPLSALDDVTREEMRAVLRNVREHTHVTTLHVTHHADDARDLADHVLFLRDGGVVAGKVSELGKPVISR